MRILITSTDHSHYNETGVVVRDLGARGVEVLLDRIKQKVVVPEGQWKVLKLQS